MSPMIAGIGMTISSLFVVFNALRLKRVKKENI
jgi:cation transport ATPase